MPIKKWLFQYLIALPVIALLLSIIQYLKGRTIEYSVEFGILWAVISIGIFAVTRAYNYRKNIQCDLCNDLPTDKRTNGDM